MVVKGDHRKGAGSSDTLHRKHLTLKLQLAKEKYVLLQTASAQLVFLMFIHLGFLSFQGGRECCFYWISSVFNLL